MNVKCVRELRRGALLEKQLEMIVPYFFFCLCRMRKSNGIGNWELRIVFGKWDLFAPLLHGPNFKAVFLDSFRCKPEMMLKGKKRRVNGLLI